MDSHSSLLIVIATYNEIDNLPRLVEELERLLPAAEILVIDDGSPDGTGDWCDSAQVQHPRLSVIHRAKKMGLGSAAIEGFQAGLKRQVSLIATMDADFSHDPNSLAKLVSTMEQPANQQMGVAIGSRYVAGGGIDGWPLFRRFASRGVNAFARIMLGLETHDNSGAFRVYRADALKKIEIDRIRSTGYGYLEETLWRLKRAGVAMIEVPIVFRDRTHGKSKTSLRGGLAVFWQISKMGLGRWK